MLKHRGLALPVDIAAVSDADDGDDQILVHDLVEKPVVALPYPILVFAGELLCPRWPGVRSKGFDSRYETAAISEGDGLELFGR